MEAPLKEREQKPLESVLYPEWSLVVFEGLIFFDTLNMSSQVHRPLSPVTYLRLVSSLLTLRSSAASTIQQHYRRHLLIHRQHSGALVAQLMRVRTEAAALIQASFHAYRAKPLKRRLKLVFAEKKIAHPTGQDFTVEGTEDACFTDETSQTFGIADGVGAWKEYGVSASMFSQELMQRAHAIIMRDRWGGSVEERKTELVEVLKEAHRRMESYGSSTALLGVIRDCHLTATSIGDSSLLVLRAVGNRLQKAYKTREKQHFFNCPFQLANFPQSTELSALPPVFKKLAAFLKSSKPVSDSAADAVTSDFKLIQGDILIVATDGLFDNLYKDRILELAQTQVSFNLNPHVLARNLATVLARKAATQSLDPLYFSPFARAARRARYRFSGGKADDITVVVGVAINQ
jgi:protein phosphatase PTC7